MVNYLINYQKIAIKIKDFRIYCPSTLPIKIDPHSGKRYAAGQAGSAGRRDRTGFAKSTKHKINTDGIIFKKPLTILLQIY